MNKHLPLLLLSVACVTGNSAVAATLTLAGSLAGITGANNDQIDQFRSTSVLKTLDADGDNVYGSSGYILFATENTVGGGDAGVAGTGSNPLTYVNGNKRTRSSIPAYLTFSLTNAGQSGVASAFGYQAIDNPEAAGALVADIESGAALRNATLGSEVDFFDVTLNAGFPTGGIRLGLLFGNTDAYNGNFRVAQTVGGASSFSVTQVNPGTGTIPQMGFFDITNGVAGDTFRVFATKTSAGTGGNGNANVLLGGFTIDAIVPEPGRMMLLGTGLLALARRRRRAAAPINQA